MKSWLSPRPPPGRIDPWDRMAPRFHGQQPCWYLPQTSLPPPAVIAGLAHTQSEIPPGLGGPHHSDLGPLATTAHFGALVSPTRMLIFRTSVGAPDVLHHEQSIFFGKHAAQHNWRLGNHCHTLRFRPYPHLGSEVCPFRTLPLWHRKPAAFVAYHRLRLLVALPTAH